MGIKGDPGIPGHMGPPGPRGPQGVKGEKGEQGKSLSAPRLMESPADVTVNEGQTTVLKCIVDGYPPSEITWSKINASLPVGRHMRGSSSALMITDTKRDDAGVYSCSAQNLLGSAIAFASLEVHFAPRLFLSSNRVMAEEEQNITIACSATGHPQPNITWSKAIGSLPVTTVANNKSSQIFNVKGKDRGTYVCKAESILGTAERAVQLVIFSRMRFLVRPPQELTPIVGSSVHVPCVPKSDLKTNVTWLKDGKSLLPIDSNILQDNTLVIPNVTPSHIGSYICRANNALTAIEARVEIKTPSNPSCSVIRKYVRSSSGNYVIDPDGEGGLAPFTVHCDMTDKNGVGVTVISHDSESRTLVDGYSDAGSYSRSIHYSGASFSQLASLTDVSLLCEQFIKYECYHSFLLDSSHGWWVSRDSNKMLYWGGASSSSNKCACGMTSSCADSSHRCNCDKNDGVWREDSGLIDKTQLPVRELRFGDTTEYDGYDEKGYHTLGKFKCYGIAEK